MHTPLFFAIIFLVLATSALDPNQVQCLQTYKNLGCLTGIYFGTTLQSVYPDWPVGCACQICNNNVQCNVNADAVNYCQGILGCAGADCYGGMFNCLACPATSTVKFQRRKLAIGVYIKIVGQITSYLMSGQRALNSIPTKSYGRYKKWTNFHEVHTKIRPVQDQNELLSTGF